MKYFTEIQIECKNKSALEETVYSLSAAESPIAFDPLDTRIAGFSSAVEMRNFVASLFWYEALRQNVPFLGTLS